MGLALDARQLNEFLERDFWQIAEGFRVLDVTENCLTSVLSVSGAHVRPGGTISGPTMFGLADVTIYCAILSRIGLVPLAVTTNASIDFMRKPEAGRDLRAECRLLKLGRNLAVGDVLIFSDGVGDPVARSTMTYAIPPQNR